MGKKDPKIAKNDLPPIHFKNRKFSQNLVMKHVFWTFWIQKTLMQVSGWVVGRGATWGAARGSKWAKIRFQWRWPKKIRNIQNLDFLVRYTSNVMIYAQKFDLFGV